MRSLFLMITVVLISGCAGFAEHLAEADCMYIGCETGGLVIYDHEEFSHKKQSQHIYDRDGNVVEEY